MRAAYNGGYAVPGLDDTAARESFESGQSAMVIVGPWEDQAATDKGINHDTFAVPDGDGTYKYADGKTGSNTGSTGLCWWVTLAGPGDSEKAARHLRVLQVLQQPRQPGEVVPRLRLPAEQRASQRRWAVRPSADAGHHASTPDNSYIGIAGLKARLRRHRRLPDALTQNTVRTGDD
ncbi:MAG: hypothetical protein ACLRL4_00025 [Bifidobacterium bifidum]